MIGNKKEWGKEEDRGIKIEERLVVSKIKGVERRKDCTITSIYNAGNWDRLEEVLEEVWEEGRKETVIIGGDFNLRIVEEEGLEEDEESRRKSKDEIVGNEGRGLMDK